MSSSSSPARAKVDASAFPYQEVSLGGAALPPVSIADELQSREEVARAAGLREGELRVRAGYEREIQECRKSLADALAQFARQRGDYFRAVEREVVQLALAIAHKILRREAQLDSMLLAGMARVALDQIHGAGKTTVRVHPAQASDFRIFFAQQLPENPPEILEDPSLDPAGCVLETSLGKTEIGPEIQLKEIEQGLLDLQAERPK